MAEYGTRYITLMDIDRSCAGLISYTVGMLVYRFGGGSAGMGSGYKILIIDDQKDIRQALARIVERKGYESVGAETGAQAIELARKEKPIVVLLDLLLDDMPGLAVMASIKKFLPLAEFIIITGAPTKESAVATVNLGAFGYIEKPWDNNQLIVSIKSAIEKAETAEALAESEARYRMLAEFANDFIFLVDKDMRMKYINPAGAVPFKSAPMALMGKTLKQLFPPAFGMHLEDTVNRVIHDGDSIVVEDEYPFPSGVIKLNVRFSPVKNGDGSVIAVHAICRETGRPQRLS